MALSCRETASRRILSPLLLLGRYRRSFFRSRPAARHNDLAFRKSLIAGRHLQGTPGSQGRHFDHGCSLVLVAPALSLGIQAPHCDHHPLLCRVAAFIHLEDLALPSPRSSLSCTMTLFCLWSIISIHPGLIANLVWFLVRRCSCRNRQSGRHWPSAKPDASVSSKTARQQQTPLSLRLCWAPPHIPLRVNYK